MYNIIYVCLGPQRRGMCVYTPYTCCANPRPDAYSYNTDFPIHHTNYPHKHNPDMNIQDCTHRFPYPRHRWFLFDMCMFRKKQAHKYTSFPYLHHAFAYIAHDNIFLLCRSTKPHQRQVFLAAFDLQNPPKRQNIWRAELASLIPSQKWTLEARIVPSQPWKWRPFLCQRSSDVVDNMLEINKRAEGSSFVSGFFLGGVLRRRWSIQQRIMRSRIACCVGWMRAAASHGAGTATRVGEEGPCEDNDAVPLGEGFVWQGGRRHRSGDRRIPPPSHGC